MHARVTTFQANMEHADEGAEIFREGIPTISLLDGFVDAVLLLDRESGKAMTIAVWTDEQSMRDSALAVGSLFQKAAHTIQGETKRQHYEVAEYRPGTGRKYARVSSGAFQPGGTQAAGATSIIDAASQQPGYAGFLSLTGENGQFMGMSFWDSMENLDASEGGYYTEEMEKSRDQYAGSQWLREVYEVVA